jgi:tetratricopeptide (TPR) repeat protein
VFFISGSLTKKLVHQQKTQGVKMQKDNEFISLYLENEASKIRVELLKENQELRLELEAIKSASTSLLADVQNKIANAEDKITEKAIDKTLTIIQQVKTWISIAAVLISGVFILGSLLGYKNLSETLTATFNDKVTRWMRFDDPESGGRKALDELRTEAIINAYMIRLARNYSSVSESLFPLNGPEEKRLLDILQTPTTRYSEFSDALTIIVKNRGPFRLALSEDDVGKKIASLLSADGISPDKRGLVLERLKGDAALLPYSKLFLNDEDQNIYVRMAAFENVKMFDSEMAIEFAEKNIGKIKPGLKGDLVLYLAKESEQYEPALHYVRELIDLKPDYWQSSVLELVSRLGETLPSTVNPSAYKLADLFIQVVELGGKIDISDERFGPKRIALQLDGAYSMLTKPGRLLNDPALIKAIITKRDSSIDWLAKSTDFFQISDQGILLTTLIVKLGDKASIETWNQSILTNKDVLGDVWLRTQNLPGGKQLMATWRDKETGVIHTDSVSQVSQLADMDFNLSFDERLLESLSYDYRSPADLL